jgi:hypothetical protein
MGRQLHDYCRPITIALSLPTQQYKTIAATKCRSGRVILPDQNFDPPQLPISLGPIGFWLDGRLRRFTGGLGNEGRARKDAGGNQRALGGQFVVVAQGCEM